MTLSPKRLNFSEMWKLYQIIKREKHDSLVVDEFVGMLKEISPSAFMKAVHLLYPNSTKENGLIMADRFLQGIQKNNFFMFSNFIETLKNDR
jgi:hypothetical protein